jgi:glycosyltransferase involved in cell wall biosynthesis
VALFLYNFKNSRTFVIKYKNMLFSIITINYNNCEGLRQTIDSVVSQTYHEYEYIVIDGGSTDESVNIIKSFSDKIDYWVSEKDRGIYHAMNKGVAHAHGEYCIFMNSGDCLYDDKVLGRLADTDFQEDIVVGKLISDTSGQILFTPPIDKISLYYLYSGTVPHQSSFIRTELLRKIPYDESLKIVSDWKFFVQAIILSNCSVRYVDVFVAKFDMEGISTSNPERMWKEKEQVISSMFPPRVLADYKSMKASECLTQTLTPQLRHHYRIDKFLYGLGRMILKFTKK